jgi:DedD protein
MDPQLKQRLVGAAVLVALAVIFVPTFLHTSRPASVAVQRDIAPMPADQFSDSAASDGPELEPLVVSEIDKGLDASADALEEQVAPAAGKTTDLAALQAPAAPVDVPDASPPTAVPTDAPVTVPLNPVAGEWTIQLGSFASEGNANGLLAKLQKAGFPAFLAPLERDDRRSYRVRVGQASTREDAERLHARLAQTLGYTGMVVRNQ